MEEQEMARPSTKEELINAANIGFEKMWGLVEVMSEDQRNETFHFDEILKEAHWKRDKNLRDVFIHLYEWHQLLLIWVSDNLQGNPKPFLPAPYNWKTYGQMNMCFWEKHQQTSLNDSVNMLRKSHEAVMKMIESFDDDVLFSKGKLSWTGTTTLGSYCVSATSSHYDWAVKKIKAHIKTRKMQ